ncbi:MAG: hypothetical protein Kow00124_10980 [Anaerolineae bacterium]
MTSHFRHLSSPRPAGEIKAGHRVPATEEDLHRLLAELGIRPPGPLTCELVSTWAAKHVWRLKAGGEPFVYVRYLLGPASLFPDRWRHMRLGEMLYDARVGPRILGVIPESEALGGRAAIVEAALEPISPAELAARAEEAILLMARLHSYVPLHEALSADLIEADRLGVSSLARLFTETRERWFEAVVPRWLEVGLSEITDLQSIVGELLSELQKAPIQTGRIGLVVPAHHDPNHGNFMVNRQGALRLIDFEGLALDNPVADLGVFLDWYVEPERHRALLKAYPLADPDAVLERMRVWVPLRYIEIAAYWAARLTRARDSEAWLYAASSLHEWLSAAARLIYSEGPPARAGVALEDILAALLARTTLAEDAGQGDDEAEHKKLA